MQVTEAVRDATVSAAARSRRARRSRSTRTTGCSRSTATRTRRCCAALGKLEPGYGVITIYYGEGSTLDDAETLSQQIQEAAPGLEAVDVLHGGQPHYRYLISAE